MTKTPKGVNFEAFELTPPNEKVISTEGRLRRHYPDHFPTLNIPTSTFDDSHFQSTLAETLSTMSCQKAVGMTPTVRKSDNDVDEIRDTIHPGLVTELIYSFLSPFFTPTAVPSIWKHIREEVSWRDARLP